MTIKKTHKSMRLVKETLRRLDGELARVRGGGDVKVAASPPTPFCDMSIRG